MVLQKQKQPDFVEFIGRTRSNNGVKGYLEELETEANQKGIISVSQVGTIVAQIRSEKWYASQNIFSLNPLKNHKGWISLYTLSAINKSLTEHFSDGYGNYPTLKKLKDLVIQLPIKNNGQINFSFMEKLIAELEAQHLAELEVYLLAAGLKDYTLTAEEQKALDDFEDTSFLAFNVVDIFNVNNTRNLLSRDIVKNSGDIPYLCASAENNSVSSYISYNENYLDEGNCIFIGGKTFVVSYQEKDFYSNDSHNLALYLKGYEKNKLNQLYLAICIDKSLSHKYSWGDSISNTKIQKDKVSLPVTNETPNYKMMNIFISAIQKLVIKDVVLYADKKISATKKIVDA